MLFSKIVSAIASRDWVHGGGAWRLAGSSGGREGYGGVRETACNDVMAKDR